eukprot:921478-Rhodomonas_salina.1
MSNRVLIAILWYAVIFSSHPAVSVGDYGAVAKVSLPQRRLRTSLSKPNMRPLLCQLASSVRTSQVIEKGGGGEEDGEGSCCHVILRTTAGPGLRGLALRGGGVVSELHEDEELDSEAGSEEGGQGVRGGGRDAGALSVDTSEEDSGDGEDDSGDSHETEKRGARTDGQRRKLAAGRKRGRVASSSDVSEGDSDEGERQGASDEEENEDDEEEERAGGGSSNPAPAKQKSAGKGFGSEYQDLDVGEDVTALSFHPLTSIIAVCPLHCSALLLPDPSLYAAAAVPVPNGANIGCRLGRSGAVCSCGSTAERSTRTSARFQLHQVSSALLVPAARCPVLTVCTVVALVPGSPPVRHLTFSLDGK